MDESGSIRPEDMVREQDAASLIGQSELSDRSTVSIVGFASDNGNHSPVDVVCPPIVLSGAAERERISRCVGDLRKRTESEGSGTDHAEALKQAMSYLRDGSPEEGPKLVFLLTDGVLDVSDSPRYGVDKTGQQRNDAARAVIDQTLTEARDAGVQIWPLGFGKVNVAALRGFAAGGYQNSCGPDVPKPSATVVSSSADVADALLRAFSAGRCTGIGPIDKRPISPGGHVEVPVTIPPIATDGSIVVVKHDGRISVDYVDPKGNPVPKSGTSASGAFQVSGESSPVEVLHIVEPMPGRWTVRITSTPDIPTQDVLTTVTWLGAAQAALVVDPPSPAVGQPVTVSLQLVLRGGKLVTDPQLLTGLSFSAQLSGHDLPAQSIALQDDGRAPDGAVDGTYTGRLTVPTNVDREVTFRGTVSGLGISAADAVAVTRLAPTVPAILATTTLPTIATRVAPGGTLTATVSVTNNSDERHRVRVQITGVRRAGITVRPQDAVHEVDPGTTTFSFRMNVSANTPEGVASGRVRVVDGDGAARVLHEKPFTVDVGYPPPPFPWLWWLLATAAGLALILFVLWLVSRRHSQEVEGLVVQAVRNGRRTYLHTEARKARVFRFTVEMNEAVPRLDVARPDDVTAFALTRSRAGLRLVTPYGARHTTQLDQPVEVEQDLVITVSPDHDSDDSGAMASHAASTTDWGEPGSSSPQEPVRDPLM
ncbi:VWA domain-containing protein [Actinophytocola sp.]|uniref:VWA domain-containing protein n=1 Tax=Actinophytocola sp. TaxID=1872138 RepID=UPI003899E430